MNSNFRYILISLLLVALDQATKIAVKGFSLFGIEHKGMFLGESKQILGDFLRFTYVENPGMAFGITFGEGKILLSLFSVVASIALSIYLYRVKTDSIWVKLGLSFVLAGATGNLIDRVFYGILYSEGRLFYGLVVDFIDIDFIDYTFLGREYTRWYIFNVADACVTIGTLLLIMWHKYLPFENTVKSSSMK